MATYRGISSKLLGQKHDGPAGLVHLNSISTLAPISDRRSPRCVYSNNFGTLAGFWSLDVERAITGREAVVGKRGGGAPTWVGMRTTKMVSLRQPPTGFVVSGCQWLTRSDVHPNSIHIFATPRPTNQLPAGAITIFPPWRRWIPLCSICLTFRTSFLGDREWECQTTARPTLLEGLSYQIIVSPVAATVACGTRIADADDPPPEHRVDH